MACATRDDRNDDEEVPLISADYAALCQPERIDYMWFVIAVEALLLVAVLAKLGYDVWHYYKTGEMPWLANYICLGLGYSGEQKKNNLLYQNADGRGSKLKDPTSFGRPMLMFD